MPWGYAAAAAIGVAGSSISANKAADSAEDTAKASKEAAAIQAAAGREASHLFDPYQGLGQQGLDLAGFLTDPSAQVEFAQNNPLYQMGLQNLNEQTNQTAASRSRLSSGDTLERLQGNATLAAQPLIDRQKQDILNLLGIGQNVAGSQGNLLTGQAAATAGGVVGAQNALNAGTQAQINNVGSIAGIGSNAILDYMNRPVTPPPPVVTRPGPAGMVGI